MDATAADALTSAAQKLHASARMHKRSSDAHRKQARELMAEYDRLRQLCETHGIVVHLEPQGERSHRP